MSVTINANLNLNQGSVKKASKQVQSALNSVNINPASLDKFGGALGRITGNASEFQKSMEAATARVFAFGATAAVIQSITQSFKLLVSTTIEVEKKLVEINTIFGASEATFSKFRESIFQVAKNTGQSFNVVAEGAAELARQGLNAEETAKRLNAALVLTRVSGLDSVSSVNALTAAINGFTSASLDATTIVNKLIAVDTAFAVSAKDLADGFQRAGSTAEDAGVSFDELLGIITAVQQTTSRGGAVIGNALKSIFTRLSRSTTISELQELGVQIDANQGGIEKLKALSAALENVSDPTVASQIKELAGGVFQINVVSAALKDLSNESSIFAGAAAKAAGATNEAFQKNKDLNQTLSSQINSLVAGLTNLGEKIGSITLSPLLGDLINIANNVTDFFNDALSEENGNAFIKSFFAGIGTFIKGPGLILLTGAFLNIFKLVSKFALDGFKELTRLGKGSEKIKNIEQGIIQLLVQDKSLREKLANTTLSQAQKEELLIKAIRRENELLREQQRIVTALARAAASRGVGGFTPSGGFSGKKGKKGKNFASGFTPSFEETVMEQSLASAHGYKAGKVIKRRMFDGQGGSFIGVANRNEQFQDLTVGGIKGTVVTPPNGFAAGYVPNFSIGPDGSPEDFKTREAALKAGFSAARVGRVFGPAPKKATKKKKKDRKRTISVEGGELGIVSLFDDRETASSSIDGTLNVSDYAGTKRKGSIKPEALNDKISMTGIQVRSLGQINKDDFSEEAIGKKIDVFFADGLEEFAKLIGKTLKISGQDYDIKGAIGKLDAKPSDLFTTGVQGQLFESAARVASSGAKNAIKEFESNAGEQRPFDFEEKSKSLKSLQEAFKFTAPLMKADAKRSAGSKAANSIVRKALNDKNVRADLDGGKLKRIFKPSAFKASGYVPNFFDPAVEDAVKRETTGTGISLSQVRYDQHKAFVTPFNKKGGVITNIKDEPNGVSDVLAAGYVPNFKKKKKDSGEGSGGGFGKSFAASSVISMLSGFLQNAEGLNEETKIAVEKFSGIAASIPFALDLIPQAAKTKLLASLTTLTTSFMAASAKTKAATVGKGAGVGIAAVGGFALGTFAQKDFIGANETEEQFKTGKELKAFSGKNILETFTKDFKNLASKDSKARSKAMINLFSGKRTVETLRSGVEAAIAQVTIDDTLGEDTESIIKAQADLDSKLKRNANMTTDEQIAKLKVILSKVPAGMKELKAELRGKISDLQGFVEKEPIVIRGVFDDIKRDEAKRFLDGVFKETFDKSTFQGRRADQKQQVSEKFKDADVAFRNSSFDALQSLLDSAPDKNQMGAENLVGENLRVILKKDAELREVLNKDFNRDNAAVFLKHRQDSIAYLSKEFEARGIDSKEFTEAWAKSSQETIKMQAAFDRRNLEERKANDDAFLEKLKSNFDETLSGLFESGDSIDRMNAFSGAVRGQDPNQINKSLIDMGFSREQRIGALTSNNGSEAIDALKGNKRLNDLFFGDEENNRSALIEDPSAKLRVGQQRLLKSVLAELKEDSIQMTEGLQNVRTLRGGSIIGGLRGGNAGLSESGVNQLEARVAELFKAPETFSDIAKKSGQADLLLDFIKKLDPKTEGQKTEVNELLSGIAIFQEKLAEGTELIVGKESVSEELLELQAQTSLLKQLVDENPPEPTPADIAKAEAIKNRPDEVQKLRDADQKRELESGFSSPEQIKKLQEEIESLKFDSTKKQEGNQDQLTQEAYVKKQDEVIVVLTNLVDAISTTILPV